LIGVVTAQPTSQLLLDFGFVLFAVTYGTAVARRFMYWKISRRFSSMESFVYFHIDIATEFVLTTLLLLIAVQRDIAAAVLQFRQNRPVLTWIGTNNLG